MDKIRVLLIDGSVLARRSLRQMIEADATMEVVGVAADPMMARMLIKAKKPDVLSLAMNMENVDSMAFLADVMQAQAMPVVMVSCDTQKNSAAAARALELGAVEVMGKPSADLTGDIAAFSQEFVQKIRLAGHVHAKKLSLVDQELKKEQIRPTASPSKKSVSGSVADRHHCPISHKIVALGASTGGTEALKHVISGLPADFPAVLIVQHLPAAFAANFVKRLNLEAAMRVVEAQDGEVIHCGHIYVGASDKHFRIEKVGHHYVCRLDGDELISGHCPSVNALFDSVAYHAKSNAVGVLLTGMGDDGATGLKKMKELGVWTIAQDQESSVVWGMPGAAVKLGAAQQQLHLDKITSALLKLVH